MPITRQAKGQPNHKGNSGGDEEGTSNALPCIPSNSKEYPQGSSTGATSIANNFGSSKGRSSRPPQKKLQKCDYCKRKYKAEDLRIDSILIAACPPFASLKSTDAYCCECISHLHNLYKSWLPR